MGEWENGRMGEWENITVDTAGEILSNIYLSVAMKSRVRWYQLILKD